MIAPKRYMTHKVDKLINNLSLFLPRILMFMFVLIMAALFVISDRANAQSGSSLRLDPVTSSIDINDAVSISLVIEVEPGRNYASGSFAIEYDSSVLQVENFAIASDLFGVVNINDPGVIRLNAISTSGSTGTVILGSGQFTSIGVGDTSLKIAIVDPIGDSSGTPLPELVIGNGTVSVSDPVNTPTATPISPTIPPTSTPVPNGEATPIMTGTPASPPSTNLDKFIFLPITLKN